LKENIAKIDHEINSTRISFLHRRPRFIRQNTNQATNTGVMVNNINVQEDIEYNSQERERVDKADNRFYERRQCKI
jgi:hypothetical protein